MINEGHQVIFVAPKLAGVVVVQNRVRVQVTKIYFQQNSQVANIKSVPLRILPKVLWAHAYKQLRLGHGTRIQRSQSVGVLAAGPKGLVSCKLILCHVKEFCTEKTFFFAEKEMSQTQTKETSKTETVLQQIGESIVKLSQQCLLRASNIFVLELEADTVTLEDVAINSRTNTALTTCSTKTGIAEGPIRTGMDEALTGLQTTSADGLVVDPYSRFRGHTNGVDFVMAVRSAVTVDVVNRCLAMALNSMVLRLKNARTITLKNVTINQVANAEITECIGNVDVQIGDTTQSLRQFLERNESQYNYRNYRDSPVEPLSCQFMINARKRLKNVGTVAIGVAVFILFLVLIIKLI